MIALYSLLSVVTLKGGFPAACKTLCSSSRFVDFPVGPPRFIQAAAISGGNTVVGEGAAVTLDASPSADPDSEPGALTFSWECTPPPPSALNLVGPSLTTSGGGGAPSACLNLSGAPAGVEGVTTAALQLSLMPGLPGGPGANYTLTVTVRKGDRVARATAWLAVRAAVRLPVISVQALGFAKANPAAKLVVRATVASAFPETLTTQWSLAAAAAGGGGGGLAPGLALASAATTPLTSPSLVLAAGALAPRSTAVFRLTATDRGGTATADVAVPVSGNPTGAGGAPKGTLTVTPRSGVGLTTQFTLSAANWTDTDLPLSYSFAFAAAGGASSSSAAPPTTLRDFSPQSTAAGVLLPAGTPAGQYVLYVFCVVQNAAGAVTVSDPVPVTVTWDQSVLDDARAQSQLVARRAQDAMSKVRLVSSLALRCTT